MAGTVPQPGIMNIDLYEGGQSAIAGRDDVVKLSSNENPFGTSPAAAEAVRRASMSLNRYPSTDHASLRRAIGDLYGLDPDRIVCGVGSDEVINWLCQAYAGPGDEVLFTEHGFAMYRISALAHGATPVEAPENDRVTSVESLLAACTDRTRLVFVANPNNPTGTMIGGNELSRLADGLPEQAMLVLDGAYAEYVEGYDGGVSLIEQGRNVVMTRTFSKLYGLGGMRVGWGYGPRPVIDVLNRIRGPFNLSQPALDAAEAALGDRDFVERSLAENKRMRVWLAEALAERGVPSDTSCANFILARFRDREEAEACDAWLKEAGILVRKVAGYKLPHCLRITVGDEASCRRVAHAIGAFKDAQG